MMTSFFKKNIAKSLGEKKIQDPLSRTIFIGILDYDHLSHYLEDVPISRICKALESLGDEKSIEKWENELFLFHKSEQAKLYRFLWKDLISEMRKFMGRTQEFFGDKNIENNSSLRKKATLKNLKSYISLFSNMTKAEILEKHRNEYYELRSLGLVTKYLPYHINNCNIDRLRNEALVEGSGESLESIFGKENIDKISYLRKSVTLKDIKFHLELFSKMTREEILNTHRKEYFELKKVGLIEKYLPELLSKWNLNTLHKEALKYGSKKDFMKGNNKAYIRAYQLGVLEKITTHMKKEYRWNMEKLILEANLYKDRREFLNKSKSAYTKILELEREGNIGLMDKLCAHMTNDIIPRIKREDIQLKANLYNSRTVFANQEPRLYKAAQNKGILDEVCKHMPKNRYIDECKEKKTFLKALEKLLKEEGLEYELSYNVSIPIRDNGRGKIPVLLKVKSLNLLIPIILKTGDVGNRKVFKRRVSKYKRAYRERKGFNGVYLVSTVGQGFYPEEFLDEIRNVIRTKSLKEPIFNL